MARQFNDWYEGDYIDQVAFPLGGIGAGMICMDGAGSFSHLSFRHEPDVFRTPLMFATLAIKAVNSCEHRVRVLHGPVRRQRIFGAPGTGNGGRNTTMGLPHFGAAKFLCRFPFGTVELADDSFPVKVSATAFSPFIPLDSDNSSLPAAGIEYEFENTTTEELTATFAFNAENVIKTGKNNSAVKKVNRGLIFRQLPDEHPWDEGYVSIQTDEPGATVDPAWFRGGWFDSLTILWKNLESGECVDREETDDDAGPSPGGSLYVPMSLKPGEKRTVPIQICWYVPKSAVRYGKDPDECCADSSCCCDDGSNDSAAYYAPWYAARFKDIHEVAEYWREHYGSLREETARFRDTFYRSTLPPEILEAVSANLTILKSPTVLRQEDGRLWCYEGCSDDSGCCPGSCTHVWNYAQALPNLFPDLERSLRRTEFNESQSENGHQAFRSFLPIRPSAHDFHAASDGQFGGIMKIHREWRISGDTGWLRQFWPKIKASLDYCIGMWDPGYKGILEEPHHNTYDIEFWGPDGMCSSFYLGALKAASIMGGALGEDVAKYRTLYEKGRKYVESELFDGEYFIQQIRWKDLEAPNPALFKTAIGTGYSPEAAALLEREGPKYQYGTGCLSDGVLGAWIAEMCGVGEILDPEKIGSHLKAIHKYNLKRSLMEHANPQRPTYALEDEGGLLLCTWPKGGELSLPFVYSDEVWTGIEYQVASHLMMTGQTEEGLEIVRTCRNRYDGRRRNPFDEYECGHWYARAMASYGLIQGYYGVRYDAVDKALFIEIGKASDFEVFLSTATGYGTAGVRDGKPFVNVVKGEIQVAEFRETRQTK